MSRLADYFVIIGYDHEKESMYHTMVLCIFPSLNRINQQIVCFAGSGKRSGKIIQRFPEKDWPDTPFIEGIEWVCNVFARKQSNFHIIFRHLPFPFDCAIQFCQPLGWALSSERLEPQFFVSALTDIDANRHYCACLCFNETVAITPNKPIDEEEDDLLSPNPTIFNPAAVIAAAGAAVNSTALLLQENATKPIANITHHSIMYAPKCLVLVSRLDYPETFRVSANAFFF